MTTSTINVKQNSVPTYLTAGITAIATTIPVNELSVFYDSTGALITKGIVISYDNASPNLPEEITITGASGTSGAGNLTGVTRAVNADTYYVSGVLTADGAAQAWPINTNIAPIFSTGIYLGMLSAAPVTGPNSATSGDIATFNGTTGKIIQDGGVPISSLATDANVFHKAVSGEINAETAKGSPVSADVILIEDSANSFSKAKITIGSLPSGSGNVTGPSSSTSGDLVTFNGTTGKIIQDSGIGFGASTTTFLRNDGTWQTPSGGGGSSPWTALTATTDFATTGASTSTITMNTDQTANIKIGTRIKMTFNSATQYGIVSAITSALLTFRGQAITTGSGLLTALSWGDASRNVEITFTFPSYYEGATTSTAINDRQLGASGFLWKGLPVYFVGFDIRNGTADSGGTQAIINSIINGNALSTSNSSSGISISGTSVTSTAVDINATLANTLLSSGQFIEVKITKGTNGDGQTLSVTMEAVNP